MKAQELLQEAVSQKNELSGLIRKTNNISLLTKILNYLALKVGDDEVTEPDVLEPNTPEPKQPPVASKPVPVTESAESNIKAKVLAMLDGLDDDSPEWEKIIGVLRKDELTQLSKETVHKKMGSINNHLDKKLRDMVLRLRVSFEHKSAFLSKLARGDGFFDGKILTAKNAGNVYGMVAGDPVASIIARQMAIEFRGDMGYGPDQGPGEIMMVLLGNNISLATKGDLLIGGKVVEVKATGKSAKNKFSGGRLYSTSGYGTSGMIKRELYNNLLAAGIPRDELAQYGMPKKDPDAATVPGGFNLNPSGLLNLSNIFKEYKIGQKEAQKILSAVLNGLYTSLPDGMETSVLNLVKNDGTFDPNLFLIAMTKLAHDYYMMIAGHDVLLLFNSASGNYAAMVTSDDVEMFLKNGTISLAAHINLDDDRGKGSSQIIIK